MDGKENISVPAAPIVENESTMDWQSEEENEEIEVVIGENYLVKKQDDSYHPAMLIQTRLDCFGRDEYYIHYDGINRRLDQWVTKDRIKKIPPEQLKEYQKQKSVITQTTNIPIVDTTNGSMVQVGAPSEQNSDRKVTRNQKRRHDEINHVQKTFAEMDPTTAALEKEHEAITKVCTLGFLIKNLV